MEQTSAEIIARGVYGIKIYGFYSARTLNVVGGGGGIHGGTPSRCPFSKKIMDIEGPRRACPICTFKLTLIINLRGFFSVQS